MRRAVTIVRNGAPRGNRPAVGKQRPTGSGHWDGAVDGQQRSTGSGHWGGAVDGHQRPTGTGHWGGVRDEAAVIRCTEGAIPPLLAAEDAVFRVAPEFLVQPAPKCGSSHDQYIRFLACAWEEWAQVRAGNGPSQLRGGPSTASQHRLRGGPVGRATVAGS